MFCVASGGSILPLHPSGYRAVHSVAYPLGVYYALLRLERESTAQSRIRSFLSRFDDELGRNKGFRDGQLEACISSIRISACV
jgi:hypothetical protein